MRAKHFLFMDSVYELRKLSELFFDDYPSELFPELERKRDRPYLVFVLLIRGKKFALPLRSNINHPYCYRFHSPKFGKEMRPGIDFSKAIVIENELYLGGYATIRKEEMQEIARYAGSIIERFSKYLDGYVSFCKTSIKKGQRIERKYLYTTLRYFEASLLSL